MEEKEYTKQNDFKDLNHIRNYCKKTFDKSPYYKRSESGEVNLYLSGEIIGKLQSNNINNIISVLNRSQLKEVIENKKKYDNKYTQNNNSYNTSYKKNESKEYKEKIDKFKVIKEKGILALYEQIKHISFKKPNFNKTTKIDDIVKEYESNFNNELNKSGFTDEDRQILRNDIKECWKILRNDIDELRDEYYKGLIADYREETYGVKEEETLELLNQKDTIIEVIDNKINIKFNDKENEISAVYGFSNNFEEVEEVEYKSVDIKDLKKDDSIKNKVKDNTNNSNIENNTNKKINYSQIEKNKKDTQSEQKVEKKESYDMLFELYNYIKDTYGITPNVINKKNEKGDTKKVILVGNQILGETLDSKTNKLSNPVSLDKIETSINSFKNNQEVKRISRLEQINKRKEQIRSELSKIEYRKNKITSKIEMLNQEINQLNSQIDNKKQILEKLKNKNTEIISVNNSTYSEDIIKNNKPSIEDRIKGLEDKHKETSSLNIVKYQKEDKSNKHNKEDNTSKKPLNRHK